MSKELETIDRLLRVASQSGVKEFETDMVCFVFDWKAKSRRITTLTAENANLAAERDRLREALETIRDGYPAETMMVLTRRKMRLLAAAALQPEQP